MIIRSIPSELRQRPCQLHGWPSLYLAGGVWWAPPFYYHSPYVSAARLLNDAEAT